MSAVHNETVPKGALIAAASLVIMTIVVTGAVRLTGTPPAASPALLRVAEKATALSSRDLRFTDRADGAVVIEDIGSGATAGMVEAGSKSGFIRGVMRGLARERRMHGVGDQPPFRLTLWSDGELSLVDTATGRNLELGAFGGTNRAAFLALLPAEAKVADAKLTGKTS
jgi:putative photosynthetic complex assembly protein